MTERPVYIIASPFKTGTSSIAQALVTIGVAQAPMPYRGDLVAQYRPQARAAQRLVRGCPTFAQFARAHGDAIQHQFSALMQDSAPYDIFHDAPLGHSHIHPFVLKVLLPNARFIWVKRPKNAWLRSVQNWETTHPDVYPDHHKWRTDPDEMVARKMRRRRRARTWFGAIRRAFGGDTLVMEWSDLGDFGTLAGFCGVDPPTAPFPHKNKAAVGSKEY